MKFFRKKEKGFTLVEAAVVLLLLSIALIPVVKLVSNKAGSDASSGVLTGNSAGRLMSEEMSVANAIMEKAVANEIGTVKHPVMAEDGSILGFDSDGTFVKLDSDGNYTTTAYTPTNPGDANDYFGGSSNDTNKRTFVFPKYRYLSTGFFYQWEVQDATMQQAWTDASRTATQFKSFLPKGNNLVKAVLRVYSGNDARTKTNAQYSVSTYFFKNTAQALAAGEQFTDRIGIIIVMDTSLSMRMANDYGSDTDLDYYENGGATGPFYANYSTYGVNTNKKLPMRQSSGIHGYDPSAVAAPYLVYRATKNDLFFSKLDDDPLTPYDERYNPCATAAPYNYDLQDLPLKTYNPAVLLPTDQLPFLVAHCANPTPALPSGGQERPDVFVRIPSKPFSTVTANLLSVSGIDLSSTPDAVMGSGCTDRNALQNSNCTIYNYQGIEYETNTKAADKQTTDILRANLFGNTQNSNVIMATLSRMESARTAVLSFIQTIEGNPGLVSNFRIGFVPFSDQVQDGTQAGIPYNEVVNLQAPSGGTFATLEESFYRINRACNFTGYSDYTYTGSTCPGNKKPIAPTGQTNLAHGLLYAHKMFQDYDAANPPLAKKIIILLTDGDPTKSATGAPPGTPTAFGGIASEVTNLSTIATNLKNDEISVYTVGLLVGTNANAGLAMDAITNAYSENSKVVVNSVGDLTPVFENIAQQAERFALEQMKQRYSYLEYDTTGL